MQTFNSAEHQAIESEDGSYTAYSTTFDEHYHSTKDGALHESLHKHVLPALQHTQNKDEIYILDICFGLGFNTLATLYALEGSSKKVHIVSPEFDKKLVRSLEHFIYPEVFSPFKEMIIRLSKEYLYRSENINISIYIGDAREFLRSNRQMFDVVYHDAFSPEKNPVLWTQEYFDDISRCMKTDGILTTYSTALRTRIALEKSGLGVYLNKGEGYRNATVASKSALLEYEKVDVTHKMACNPEVKALRDADL